MSTALIPTQSDAHAGEYLHQPLAVHVCEMLTPGGALSMVGPSMPALGGACLQRLPQHVGKVAATSIEEFLFCSGIHMDELNTLMSGRKLHTLFSSAEEFQLFRRTMHIPNAMSRNVATLTEFRAHAQMMRERRVRHVARRLVIVAAALPALRARKCLVHLIGSFFLERTATQTTCAATVCLCLAHGCHHRTIGVESFVQHLRTAHAATETASPPTEPVVGIIETLQASSPLGRSHRLVHSG